MNKDSFIREILAELSVNIFQEIDVDKVYYATITSGHTSYKLYILMQDSSISLYKQGSNIATYKVDLSAPNSIKTIKSLISSILCL